MLKWIFKNTSKWLVKAKKQKHKPKHESDRRRAEKLEKLQVSKEKKPKKRPELSLVALLKKYLIQKKVSEHVDVAIPDPRDPKKITYSKNTIFFSALAIFLLRMTSGNRFDELTHSAEGPYTEANLSRFIDSHNKIPAIKTIQDFLKKVSYTHFNRLMIDFFKQLQESKFFFSTSRVTARKIIPSCYRSCSYSYVSLSSSHRL